MCVLVKEPVLAPRLTLGQSAGGPVTSGGPSIRQCFLSLQRGVLLPPALEPWPGLQGPGVQGGKRPRLSSGHSECGFSHICLFSVQTLPLPLLSSPLSTAWHLHLSPVCLQFSRVTSSSLQGWGEGLPWPVPRCVPVPWPVARNPAQAPWTG